MSLCFKSHYSILPRVKLVVPLSSLKADSIYRLTNTPEKKTEFILSLFEKANVTITKRSVHNFTDRFLTDVVFVSSESGLVSHFNWTTENQYVVVLPDIDKEKVTYISVVPFFKIFCRRKVSMHILHILVKSYIKAFSKLSQRTIQTEQVKINLTLLITLWLFYVYNQGINLSEVIVYLKETFPDAIVYEEAVQENIEIVRKGLDAVIKRISELLETTEALLKERMFYRYSVDFLIGFEDIVHGVLVLLLAEQGKIPGDVYNLLTDHDLQVLKEFYDRLT